MSASLPPGLTTRALTPADSTAVFELMAAQELHDTGEVVIEEDDIVSDWARPSHDLSSRSVAVLDGDRLVGYGELMGADRADTAVHPQWRGLGIGTWIAAWLQDAGRRAGSTVVGMPVAEGSAGDLLLDDLGFRVRWTSWVLRLPEGARVQERELPEGYAVGEAAPDDYPRAHTLLEDAFLEWSVRERESYDDFLASTTGRPGWAPWCLRIVTDPDGDVVGAAIVHLSGTSAFVDRLATRTDQRNRGIAQALLVDAFAAGREHGATLSELSTDSRTGALALYEKVGMVATSTWFNRAIEL